MQITPRLFFMSFSLNLFLVNGVQLFIGFLIALILVLGTTGASAAALVQPQGRMSPGISHASHREERSPFVAGTVPALQAMSSPVVQSKPVKHGVHLVAPMPAKWSSAHG